MEICYILDASAFINGFQLVSKNNFTVPEITEEIKDFESKLTMDMAIEEGRLRIQDVPIKYITGIEDIISKSGDVLRLSEPDKKLIALAYMLSCENKNIMVISDDYTIQNTLKILNIPFSGVLTFGIFPQKFFPQWFVAAMIVPGFEIGTVDGEGKRFIDNIVESFEKI